MSSYRRDSREWVCGLSFLESPTQRKYLPRTSLSVHSHIIGSMSRSVLTQAFFNPRDKSIPELRYTFPLYDGVSVVGFVCTVNNERVIRGIVKEKAEARETFKVAVARGETAGLLEQLPDASDVFTTTIGNIPAEAEIKVELTYLGELKHDAESDGIRLTIPTKIAPRYGSRQAMASDSVTHQSGIEIVVDAEMPQGSNIKAIQSPSHPISVTIGNTSLSTDAEMSLQKASATLSLDTAQLDKDFVVHVVATNSSNPVAVLETHPTIANQRALMATLVPKFNLPPARPEVVFVCDRSGSMGDKISNLKAALHIFLKSLPLGVKFNICSFGSHHEFLFENGSRTYDRESLEQAELYVNAFAANFGGTEMYAPIEAAFKQRYKDMNLEVFLLTDGEIWDQEKLFNLINKHVSESKGDIRLFTLGIGNAVSHALIEGVARAGNGFAQSVGDKEKMNAKVLRMLKAALSPHIKDYTLEIKYGKEEQASASDGDDFELVEKVMDSLNIQVAEDPKKPATSAKKTISLFDPSADADVDIVDVSLDQSASGKYSHVPPVAEPKILQAPFNIPPLYPFNRTSVYLLLSAQSPQKEIKSVVLRGTSAHGPLKLEIPVTKLTEKGETIHQLAARKAVKELEEGRGWLYHAKDAKDPEKLLKDKFEGRFSDMVEREAVRLGVTFQVGGKWCSFVAVENSTGKEEEQERIRFEQPEESADETQWGSSAPPGAPKMRTMALASPQSRPPRPLFALSPDTQATTSSFGQFNSSAGQVGSGLFGRSTTAALSMAVCPPPPPAPKMLFASGGPPPAPQVSFGGPPQQQAQQQSSEAMPTATSVSRSFAALDPSTVPMDFSMDFATPMFDAAPLPDFDFDAYEAETHGDSESEEDDDADEAMSFGLMDDGSRHATRSSVFRPSSKKRAAPVSSFSRHSKPSHRRGDRDAGSGEFRGVDKADKRDVFDHLVTLQTFEGSWPWNREVFDLLGLKETDDRLVALMRDEGLIPGSHILATALVLGFMAKRLADRREEWDLICLKAKDWLLKSGAADLEKWIGKLAELF